jgi:HPt (histidine-containing phosphotransfer) domain-containing protein
MSERNAIQGVNAQLTRGLPSGEVAAAARPVLDPQVLAQLRALDPVGANRLMPRVFETFRSSLVKLLSQLAHARAQSDAAALRLTTHTLKSSSASVGALLLSSLSAEAENVLRAGDLDQLPPALDRLVVEAARVDAAVLQLLSDS